MFGLVAALLTDGDPYLLDIGAPGRVSVSRGYVETKSGRPSTAEDIAKAADGVRFVFVGESHDNPDHHQAQADIISALIKRGRNVSVGFEMFTRDNQANLNPFTMGWWSDEEFQTNADWKKQWGFPYRLYKPIFDVVKQNQLPMAALNVPRDWVRQVSRQGADSLTDEQKKWVPAPLDLGNKEHRSIFDALIGGHPSTGADGMYAGQVTWDTGMANSALDFMADSKSPKAVMVVCAGSGHVMYGQGINWRIQKRTGEKVLTVTCIDTDQPREVSKGLGDFVFAAPPAKG
ncbi:MAG: ChaN family lipoprotein [Armatimonadetes bacterium]|nr:ChaN family lipoprotein [Armatimonadota bacterium]